MGVKKVNVVINFYLEFLDSDARDSSSIHFQRVIVFIEEIPIRSLSIVLIGRNIVSTHLIHKTTHLT